MCGEIPAEYFDGITEVVASPRARPHPDRTEVFTLGECVPLPLGDGDPESIQSRIVLYHGSFRALAETELGFDWHGEAWETLTHELRHHIEWRAQRDDLGGLDDVMETNFARHAGEAFDPLFFRDGVAHPDGVFEVGDDWFIDRVVRELPREVTLAWRGQSYDIELPAGLQLPAYLVVEGGIPDPPPGELVLVVRRLPRFRDMLHSVKVPAHHQVTALSRDSEVDRGL